MCIEYENNLSKGFQECISGTQGKEPGSKLLTQLFLTMMLTIRKRAGDNFCKFDGDFIPQPTQTNPNRLESTQPVRHNSDNVKSSQ